MAKPSDKEYSLYRKIKEIEDQNRKKDELIAQLKKKLDKAEAKDIEYKPVSGKKKIENGCPTCGASVKDTILPFGKLKICLAGCGWRSVIKDE